MEKMIIIVHVVMAVSIIGLIMIQQGKGADMGASFGSGSSQTVFGAGGGANLLTRMTSIAVFVFFATSFGLAIVAKDKARNLGIIDIPVVEEVSAPEIPDSDAGLISESDIPE